MMMELLKMRKMKEVMADVVLDLVGLEVVKIEKVAAEKAQDAVETDRLF